MSYTVELTQGVIEDLDRLTTALAERWPEGARRIIPRFYAALPRLESFPLSCGLAYESQRGGLQFRNLRKAQIAAGSPDPFPAACKADLSASRRKADLLACRSLDFRHDLRIRQIRDVAPGSQCTTPAQ